MVTHKIGGMTMVENPTQCFCEHVCGIHDSRKVHQNDVVHKPPMLQCKISDFYMTRAISGSTVLDNLDRQVVVFVDGSGLSLSVTQFMKNKSQTFGDFCGSICGYEFCFRGTLRTDMLCARTISHDTTGQATSTPCCRATLMQFVSVWRIDMSNQLSKMGRGRNDWKGVIRLHGNMRNFRK